MDYKKRLDTLFDLQEKEKALSEQIDKIKDEIQEEMNKSGIDRVSSDKLMAVKASRKYKKIKNDVQALMWVKSKKMPEDSYMNVDKKKVLDIASKAMRDGENIDWIEETETEYITIREKKEDK